MPRGRGRPPRISRQQIVDAAVSLSHEVAVGVKHAAMFLFQVVFSGVRAELEALRAGPNVHRIEIEEAVVDVPADALKNVRAYLDAGGHAGFESQFAFNIDRIIAGLADYLAQTQNAPAVAAAGRRSRRRIRKDD